MNSGTHTLVNGDKVSLRHTGLVMGFYVNDVLIDTATDPTNTFPSAGTAGLLLYCGTAGTAKWGANRFLVESF